MDRIGMLVIISGPSGSGKGTVVKKLDTSGKFALSISMTTRNKREGEIDGKDYFFCTPDEFEVMRANGEFLEHIMFNGNYYGTPRKYVEEQINAGKAVVLEIEVKGALQVKDKFNECVLVFLIPPTEAELKRRLINRHTEDMDEIEDRLKIAKDEIKLVDKYDYIVVNDDINDAVDMINTIVDAEYIKVKRNTGIIRKFKGDA